MEASSYWLIFFSAAIAINISPGPDMIYLVSKTITQGRKIGIASAFGIWCGALVHVSAAALGLSTILITSAIAFSFVKYIGAAYLVYLGIQALRSKGTNFNIPVEKDLNITPWEAFREGILVDVLNPKVAIFFMAFLPQFIRPEIGHTSAQLAILGVLVVLVAVVIEMLIILTASKSTSFFRKNRRFSVWLDRVMGSVLIGLAIRLALTDNPNA